MLKYHIQTVEVGASGAAEVAFSGIPQIYDDLEIVLSLRRATAGGGDVILSFNNSTSGFVSRRVYGSGSGVGTDTNVYAGFTNESGFTSNTFASTKVLISDYKSVGLKPYSIDSVQETNGSTSYQEIIAGTWNGAAPITAITFTNISGGNHAQYSSASLYGIKRGSSGQVEVAAGGSITTSGGYTYHTFTSSGTFVANRSLQVEALVVAGGGGGGAEDGGGGGAGGLRTTTQLISAASYSVVVGSGGVGSTAYGTTGAKGGDSSVIGPSLSIVSSGGGGGKTRNSTIGFSAGGSGGGGGYNAVTAGVGNTPEVTPPQGYSGGLGSTSAASGGGGGAGEAGKNSPNAATAPSTGNGGNGLQFSTWATATGTGHQGYYAGGGGGGTAGAVNSSFGKGGLGGGADGNYTFSNPKPSPAQANTGGGGGGQGNSYEINGGNGGSGIVIIRYLTPA